MAEKNIFQKMSIKPGTKLWVSHLPGELIPVYDALPDDVTRKDQPAAGVDVIHLFVNSQADMESRLLESMPFLSANGSCWVCYPKLTSALKSDVNRDTIWKFAQQHALKAVFMISINETWSALRLIREPQGS